MTDKRRALLEGIAYIMEVPSVTPETVLDPWDSLCVMQAVVLIDDVMGKVVHGRALADCKTAADVVKVAEA